MRIRGLRLHTAARLMLPKPLQLSRPLHVFLCIADHFEPAWQAASRDEQLRRVRCWSRNLPALAAEFADSAGRLPQHTFFYPAEQYDPALLDELASLCHHGFGDVEIHLHHDNDTAENLRQTLEQFTERLFYRHNLLRKDDEGKIRYGFVHGNWALNNSRPDKRWCGVDGELRILAETGCYADFTMPSAPSLTQTRRVNGIYYAPCHDATSDAHQRGPRARLAAPPPEDALLMVQGPLVFSWRRRKWNCLPRLENGDLRAGNPPTLQRLYSWLSAGVMVEGRPDWIFLKLHTHGAPRQHAQMLLGEPMRRFHQSLASLAKTIPEFHYYYVTAHQMSQLIHQAERGCVLPDLN